VVLVAEGWTDDLFFNAIVSLSAPMMPGKAPDHGTCHTSRELHVWGRKDAHLIEEQVAPENTHE
jgi:hypothetical protein